jgi:hypothetical protein
VLFAGPKCKAGLFRDVHGRGVPGRARRANSCARERSAYHGTWSAGGGRNHDDRNCRRSKLSPPIITPRTLSSEELPQVGAGQGSLYSWFLSSTPRLLFHPSQEGRHTSRPGSDLCLFHNFRRLSLHCTFSFYFALGMQVQSLGLSPERLHHVSGPGPEHGTNLPSTPGETS